MVYAEWQVGQVFWSMLWFTMFFLWIWVLIVVFGDIFRSRDMGGWGKALWTIFVFVAPLLGVLAYMIVRGNKIGQHRMEDAQEADVAMRAYIRSAVDTPVDTPGADLSTLVDLRARGVIDDTEFQTMKDRLVAS